MSKRRTTADEWFEAFLDSFVGSRGARRKSRLFQEALPRHRDGALQAEREYDAETQAFLQVARGGHLNRRVITSEAYRRRVG